MDRRSTIASRMQALENELAELEKFGEDVYENGDVLIFSVRFGGVKKYTYAALKAGGRWFLTGARSNSYYTWDSLVGFWRDSNVTKIRRVTKTKLVLDEEA